MSQKISVYSLPDLKNTSDDALPNYLNSLSFTQSHTKSNVRLLLGYAAVIIGAVTFYYDWTLGWDKTKYWTAYAVVVYFIINTAFTYWIWAVENGVIYEGEKKDGTKIVIATKTEKHNPTYFITAKYTTASAPSKWKEVSISAPFTSWFSADGLFVAKPFQQWLASSIPAIGQADQENVVEEIGRGSGFEAVQKAGLSLNDLVNMTPGGAKPASKSRKRG